MDLYWDKTMRREQMDAFEYQARAAAERVVDLKHPLNRQHKVLLAPGKVNFYCFHEVPSSPPPSSGGLSCF